MESTMRRESLGWRRDRRFGMPGFCQGKYPSKGMAATWAIIWLAGLVASIGIVSVASADDTLPSSHNQGGALPEPIRRALALPEAYRGLVAAERLDWNWLPPASAWYRVAMENGQPEFFWVDCQRGEKRRLLDRGQLALQIEKITGVAEDPKTLNLEGVSVEATEGNWDSAIVRFRAAGKRWSYRPAADQLAESLNAGNLDSLPAQERIVRSRGQGEETHLQFTNQLQVPLELFWLPADGQRVPYGRLDPGQTRQQHTFEGHAWLLVGAGGDPVACYVAQAGGGRAVIDGNQPIPKPSAGRARRQAPQPSSQSPDGRWQIELREEKAWLVPVGGQSDSVRESKEIPGQDPGQLALAGPFRWSPDSKRWAGLAREPGDQRKITLIDSRPDDQLQPKSREVPYDKPGDKIEIAWPRLFELQEDGQVRSIPIDTKLFANPWSLDDLEWSSDGKRLTFWYIERGHQCVRWLAVDAVTGEVTVLLEETSATFIDYAHKMQRRRLESSGELVWMSERSGWCHLDLHDAMTGARKHPITSGPWVVRGIERIDESNRQIWITAGGFHPGEDPYHRHLLRVGLDGSDPVPITQGDGDHEWSFSDDGRWILDRYSRVDLPPVHQLIDAESGKVVLELERAEWSELLEAGWKSPERWVAKGRDGQTDIFGILHRPSHFRDDRKYPVVEMIYAGPQGAHVPKGFGLHLAAQQMAELGFIVVQIDGMGTSHRSKAFHDVCWKNLGDAGFPDRRLWMEAAARKYPQIDLTRVGITGGSAGGQNALGALLFHGDFYDAAVADCGCHDNRMDKIWWNELWMGWPIGEHYAQQSNVDNAHRLQGELMLIVGELDDNVDPASTLQVADALIAADKNFDLLWMTGRGHGAGGSAYGRRRTWEFFLKHLRPETIEPVSAR
ncbi:MAG: prolyl oligopeptidase family serine peptidase [Pirellulaceae bacterium]